MLRKTAVAVLGIGVLAAGAAAGPALGARKASSGQTKSLTKAIQTTRVAGLHRVPRSNYRVVNAKVSTVARNWATAEVQPTRQARSTFQSGYFVAVQPAGLRTWVVVDAGSAEVGCGIAPNAVLEDLGIPCPPGEGIG